MKRLLLVCGAFLLAASILSAQQIGEPARPIGEFGISVPAAIVDEGRLCATPGNEVALEKIGSGIICHQTLGDRPSSSV